MSNEAITWGILTGVCTLLLLAMIHQTAQVRKLYYMFAEKVDADREKKLALEKKNQKLKAGKMAWHWYDKQVTMSTITLGEFLNIMGDDDTPMLILMGEGKWDIFQTCGHWGDYGVMQKKEIRETLLEDRLDWEVVQALEMKATDKEGYIAEGYVLWIKGREDG